MKFRFILIIIVILTLTACNKEMKVIEGINIQETKQERDIKSNNTKTRYVNEYGAIRIIGDNTIKPNEKSNAEIVIDFFFDPACKASANYNTILYNLIKKDIDNGTIEIKYRPTPYLNDKTIDDYSNRATAYILAVAEYAPSKVFDFIQIILSLDFRPEFLSSELTSDDKFIKALNDAGLSEEEVRKVEDNKENFVATAIASAEDFLDNNSEWIHLSSKKDENGKNIIYTPFILINEAGKRNANSLIIDENFEKEVESAIKELRNN